MDEDRRVIKVNIYGSEYAIRGDANDDYIQSLARYVDEKMKEIAQSTHLTSPVKISILAAINMADEIFRLREHLHDKPDERQTSIPVDPLPSENEQPSLDPETGLSSVAPEAIGALTKHIQSALNEE
jgi:cell division protein ZapA